MKKATPARRDLAPPPRRPGTLLRQEATKKEARTTLDVVVTGGAGFIGSELVRQLAVAGHQVRVIDNLINGHHENIEELLGPQVTLTVADVRDVDRLESCLSGADVVFHLACLGVRHSLHSPLENHEVNATATLGLLHAARTASVGRFVYVSSSEVYGSACHGPMAEDHPTMPTTVYGASKLAGENYARSYHATWGLPTVVVRPFNAFGPRCHHEGDCGEVIPKFMLRCLAGKPMIVFGDGRQTRDFTFVGDTASGIVQAGFRTEAIGQTINLGSGREISISELAQRVADVCGIAAPEIEFETARPGDLPRLCGDSTLARRIFGFTPKISLEEGLVKLCDWYLGRLRPADELLNEEIVHNWQRAELAATLC